MQCGLCKRAAAQLIAELIGLCFCIILLGDIAVEAKGFSQNRRKGSARVAVHRFSAAGRQQVLCTVTQSRDADLIPVQMVAILADEKVELASKSPIHRIMHQEEPLKHRGRRRRPRLAKEPPVLETTGVHQVLSWDITLLPGPVDGQFHRLSRVMDVWSPRILGVEAHEQEGSASASDVLDRLCCAAGINPGSATILHPDDGAAMRSCTLAATMVELGVSMSSSRPSVGNDDADAEPCFRTMRYLQIDPARRVSDLLSV